MKEKAKNTKYREQAQRMGYCFRAFGIESWGAWGPQATAVLKQIIAHAVNTGADNTTAVAGWGAPHIAEVARQWVSIELRTEEARMLRRAVATRRMGVTRQREISDASLIYANDEDNDEDMSTRGPNDTIRREVNYRNFRERRLASDALATATARTAAEVIAAAHTRDERSGEGSRQLRERYEALMQNTTEQTEEAAAERPRWAHDDMTCPARPELNRHATTMAALAQVAQRAGWTIEQLDQDPGLAKTAARADTTDQASTTNPLAAEAEETRQEEERIAIAAAEDLSVEEDLVHFRRGATRSAIGALVRRLATGFGSKTD